MLSYTRSYVSMSDKMFDVIADKIAESYPNACILWIDQVKNETLSKRFDETSIQLHADSSVVNVEEKQLFHGTCFESISSICEEGFKKDMNTVSAYGKGTYFSCQASFSWSYMKTAQKVGDAQISYMFFADILVPTYKDKLKKTSVTSVNNDQIVVVSDDNFIYPQYVIAFHKNATK